MTNPVGKGWPLVTRARLKQLQEYNEWTPTTAKYRGYQMYWNPAQGGLWIKVKGSEIEQQ